MSVCTCPKCSHTTEIINTIDFKTFGCSNCGHVFSFQNSNSENYSFSSYKNTQNMLSIGLKGTFDNEMFEVVAVIVKNLGWYTYSREYTLQSQSGKYIYLSECNGHWIKLKEIDDLDLKKFNRLDIYYNNITYKKYDDSKTDIIYLAGFYDFQIKTSKVYASEFICPPYILSMDDFGGDHVYHGEHITKNEIEKIFKVNNLPSKNSVGIVQPFYVDFVDTAKIFVATIIIMLFIYILWSQSSTQTVLSTSLNIDTYKSKEYVSPSFEFTGGASPLKIEINAPVDNSWAYTGVSLVNENTSEEQFAEQDIEYYHGNSDGESWTEGTTNESFSFCGVEPGKYHLAFTTSAEERSNYIPPGATYDPNQPITTESVNPSLEMSIKATLEKTPFWNVGFCMLILAGGIVLLFGLKYIFEVSRWSDSSYSPYKSEES
jgi:hypothetical protein